MVWNILKSERIESALRSDLDVYVRKAVLEWVKAKIAKALFYDPSRPDFDEGFYIPLSRPEILRYLKKVTHISWISDWLVQIVEKHVEKEKEWLQALEDFEREVKLSRLYAGKTEQTL